MMKIFGAKIKELVFLILLTMIICGAVMATLFTILPPAVPFKSALILWLCLSFGLPCIKVLLAK